MARWRTDLNRWEERRRVGTTRRSFYGATEAEAVQKADLAQGIVRKGVTRDLSNPARSDGLPPLPGITLDDYAEFFYHPARSLKSPKTLEESCYVLNRLSGALGGRPLGGITTLDIERTIRNESPSFQARVRKVLHHLFTHASRSVPGVDPRVVKLVEVARSRVVRDSPFSLDELRLIHRSAKDTPLVHNGVLLAALYGLRLGESLGLRWSHVHPDRIEVREQYGGQPLKTLSSYRIIYADTSVLVPNDGEYVVPIKGTRNFYGRKPKEGDPGRGWQRVRAEAGVRELGFHQLRAGCASGLRLLGCPVDMIAELLGHAPMSVTTKHYATIRYGEQMRPWLDQWHAQVLGGIEDE